MRGKMCTYMLGLGWSMLLASCSSGGDPASSANAGVVQTYTASATAGQVLTYTLDTKSLTYAYEVVYSPYGSTGATGSGTLVANADGSYTPSTDPTAKVYALQSGLVMGAIRLTLNGGDHEVPIYGMANPLSSLSEIADIYNFVGIQCPSQTYGNYSGCAPAHGTVQVDTAGTYTVCSAGNVATGTGTCHQLTSGTTSPLGNGVWQAVRTGSTNSSYLMAFLAPNGQKVALLDLTDPGGFGYGYIVMSTQAGYMPSSVDGTWFFQTNAGTSGSLVVSGMQIVSSLGHSLTALFDAPWTGLASISSGGVAVLAGTGAYAYIDPAVPGYLEFGMRK